MKKYNFSPGDRYTIAEFIYSYTKDSLTRTHARILVLILFKHEILFNTKSWLRSIEEKDKKVATWLINLIEENISKEQITEMMREYYEMYLV